MNSYGVYQKYYGTSLLNSTSGSNIAWIGSAQGSLLFLVSIFAGPLCDLGYLCPIVYVGTFLAILGMMMTSLCQSFWQVFIAQGLLVGVGDGLLFLPSIVIVSMYFSEKKSFATGIASMGSSIGKHLHLYFHEERTSLKYCKELLYILLCLLRLSPLQAFGGLLAL